MKLHQQVWFAALAAAIVGLAACGGTAPTPPTGTATTAPGIAAPATAPETGDARTLARLALAEQRLYAPEGRNAIEHFLAQRDEGDTGADTATALAELLPYAVIGADQALARGDAIEARRIVALMQRVDGAAPALPRLRDAITTLERERVAAEQATIEATRLAETAAKAAATTAQPASAAPAPVRAAAVAGTSPAPASPSPSAPAPAPQPVAVAPPPAPPSVATAAATVAATATPTRGSGAPRQLNRTAARYPESARRRGLEGDVRVAFTILPDGNVANARVTDTTVRNGVFDRAALAAVAQWRFEPTGRALEIERTVEFRLRRSDG